MQVTAIYDIGKTNKKFFLFNEQLREVHREYARFDEIRDDDGFPCDDLETVADWVLQTMDKVVRAGRYQVKALNFSAHGASFVHLDRNGKPVSPLYNYLKPFPEEMLLEFRAKYGAEALFCKETASPSLGMLNSGLQLYWLKYARPEAFRRVRHFLHLPQYMSFLFTGIPVSEYTSIGCHTGLWHYQQGDYHDWVYAEQLDRLLPPVADARTSINLRFGEQIVKTGIGIHDSSAALIPYLRVSQVPFVLLSTGTWSVALNPFNRQTLSGEDLREDCLNFLRIDGEQVRASRLFLGNEHELQVKRLCEHFNLPYGVHRDLRFDESAFVEEQHSGVAKYRFESIGLHRRNPAETTLSTFRNFSEAYHQLMLELVEMQVTALKRAIGESDIRRIYIDGGFADNEIFVQLLARGLPSCQLRCTSSPLGSALGAALVVSDSDSGEAGAKLQMNERIIT